MAERVKVRTLCEKPVKNVFTGEGKYLRLQKVKLSENTRPISEEDSLFIFVRSGSGDIIINGVSFELKEGSLCWIQSYHVFAIEPSWADELEIWVCVYDYQLSSYLTFSERNTEVVDSVIGAVPIVYPSGEQYEEILKLYEEFDKIDEKIDCGTSLIKVGILGQLSSIFIREGSLRVKKDKRTKRPLGWNVSLYIAVHCTEALKAEDVAAFFKTDVMTMNRELRMACGCNFSQALNRARVNMAATAILFDGLSFSFISSFSGFKSEIDFYRSFKRQKGITPQEFRERSLQNSENGFYRGMIMNETVLAAIHYMYSNFSEPISLKTMAAELYTSESIIRNLLKDNLGMSYKEVLALIRVRFAETLLTSTDLPILDISISAGYNSDRTFTRVFSEVNGMTPSEFRRERQNNLGGDED